MRTALHLCLICLFLVGGTGLEQGGRVQAATAPTWVGASGEFLSPFTIVSSQGNAVSAIVLATSVTRATTPILTLIIHLSAMGVFHIVGRKFSLTVQTGALSRLDLEMTSAMTSPSISLEISM